MKRNLRVRSVAAAVLGVGLFTGFGAGAATAQIGGDTQERIRKIVQEVAKEMQEIDRLLLQGGTAEALRGLDRNVRRIDELLKQSSSSQAEVVRGIEELIQQIQSMPPSGSSSQGDESQDQSERPDRRPGSQQRPGEQRNRIETPDMVRQGQQQGQDQQQQQQQEGQRRERGQRDPRSGQDDRSAGEQRPANQPPPADGTENVDHGDDAARWGQLPKYLQFVQSRGGLPEVPEKYRKLYEAYTKQGARRTQSSGQAGGSDTTGNTGGSGR